MRPVEPTKLIGEAQVCFVMIGDFWDHFRS